MATLADEFLADLEDDEEDVLDQHDVEMKEETKGIISNFERIKIRLF